MEIELSAVDKHIIDKYGFTVSLAGDRYVVRDPSNKKLGKNGRLEGGNVTSLLIQAETARNAATPAGFVASRKKSPGTPLPGKEKAPPSPLQALTAALNPVAVAAPKVRARSTPAKRTRDMSAMNAVYDAVINGAAPMDVYDIVTSKGIKLVSDSSTYTHAAIAKRVMERAVLLGWTPPEEAGASDE